MAVAAWIMPCHTPNCSSCLTVPAANANALSPAGELASCSGVLASIMAQRKPVSFNASARQLPAKPPPTMIKS